MRATVRRQLAGGLKALLYARYGKTPGSGVRVLEYHYIDDTGSPLSVSPVDFRFHLEILRDGGWSTLTVDEYLARLSEPSRKSTREVFITFDDGHSSFANLAAPLLLEFGFIATVFVVTDLVGGCATWFDRDRARIDKFLQGFAFNQRERAALQQSRPAFAMEKLLAVDQLLSLSVMGFDLQSHSAQHHFLSSLSQSELLDDLARSRDWLKQHLGHNARILCYPYGDCTDRVASIAALAKFEAGMLSQFATGTSNQFALGRIPLGGDANISALRFGLSKAADVLASIRSKKTFYSEPKLVDDTIDLGITENVSHS